MKSPAQEAHEAHWAMRESSRHTVGGLMADKMRYRKALLLACGGDEERARQLLQAVDAAHPQSDRMDGQGEQRC